MVVIDSDAPDRWALSLRRHGRPGRKAAETPVGPRRKAWGESGLKGAYRTPWNTWQGKLRVGGRLVHCGCFATAEEAAEAVRGKAAELGLNGG